MWRCPSTTLALLACSPRLWRRPDIQKHRRHCISKAFRISSREKESICVGRHEPADDLDRCGGESTAIFYNTSAPHAMPAYLNLLLADESHRFWMLFVFWKIRERSKCSASWGFPEVCNSCYLPAMKSTKTTGDHGWFVLTLNFPRFTFRQFSASLSAMCPSGWTEALTAGFNQGHGVSHATIKDNMSSQIVLIQKFVETLRGFAAGLKNWTE